MTPNDDRGLTPLVFTHLTPSGPFELNLDTHLPSSPPLDELRPRRVLSHPLLCGPP